MALVVLIVELGLGLGGLGSEYDQIVVGYVAFRAVVVYQVYEVRPAESSYGRQELIAPEPDKVNVSFYGDLLFSCQSYSTWCR